QAYYVVSPAQANHWSIPVAPCNADSSNWYMPGTTNLLYLKLETKARKSWRLSHKASKIQILHPLWTDFTPTVEKMFILFAQFGKLSQMLVYPLQYIPLGTDLTQFD
ncbi:unnamed protein product, partial [Pelagomonas calceolata]